MIDDSERIKCSRTMYTAILRDLISQSITMSSLLDKSIKSDWVGEVIYWSEFSYPNKTLTNIISKIVDGTDYAIIKLSNNINGLLVDLVKVHPIGEITNPPEANAFFNGWTVAFLIDKELFCVDRNLFDSSGILFSKCAERFYLDAIGYLNLSFPEEKIAQFMLAI